MKILFVQKISGISGSEKYLLELLPYLTKNGFTCHFLGLSKKRDTEKNEGLLKRISNGGVTTHLIFISGFNAFTFLFKIRRLLKKENYNIVQSNLIHADFWMSLVKRYYSKFRLVSGKHGFDETYLSKNGFNAVGYFNKYILVQRFAEKRIEKSFFIGKRLMELFIDLKISKREKSEIIYYGFDIPEVKSTGSLGYRKNKNQLLIVGRLVKYKGHEYVIKAMTELRNRIPDLALVIVGDGEEKENLQKLVNDLQLNKHVHFEGYSGKVYEYMKNSDLLIVPSKAEGFGIIILEAFGCNLPVLAFDVPTCNEIIKDGENGYLVKPCDVTSIISRIQEIYLNDQQKREAIIYNAMKKLREYYSLERMAEETIKFYNSVLFTNS